MNLGNALATLGERQWWCIASASHRGMTSAAPLPSLGQIARKIYAAAGTLIFRRAGARSALGPTAGDLVLLADPRLVREPDFRCALIDALFSRDLFQARGETS
jgi:hypothetical protein